MELIIISTIVISSLIAWCGVLLLPWKPWQVREVLEDLPHFPSSEINADLSDITVVIPARDEADVIQSTLEALRNQGNDLSVILVDDCSSDGTAKAARMVENIHLELVSLESLPIGWAGKLWALEQGIRRVRTTYTLLLDADIHLSPGVLGGLRQVSQKMERPFVSVMAALPMGNFLEKLLTPAFIYFFKMLYPFALANGSNSRFASAAGGCILMESRLLTEIGGFEPIRAALIDDCALAKRIKQFGFRTWTGQSRMVESQRGYSRLQVFWAMVARSAYTQLNYSPILLLLTSLVMGILFLGPVVGMLHPEPLIHICSLSAFGVMAISYLPTLRFYDRSPLWVLLMPLIGCLYLAMTWTSAFRHYRGRSGMWKGRSYRK